MKVWIKTIDCGEISMRNNFIQTKFLDARDHTINIITAEILRSCSRNTRRRPWRWGVPNPCLLALIKLLEVNQWEGNRRGWEPMQNNSLLNPSSRALPINLIYTMPSSKHTFCFNYFNSFSNFEVMRLVFFLYLLFSPEGVWGYGGQWIFKEKVENLHLCPAGTFLSFSLR